MNAASTFVRSALAVAGLAACSALAILYADGQGEPELELRENPRAETAIGTSATHDTLEQIAKREIARDSLEAAVERATGH
jgi:hypothetical protein